MEVEVRRRHSDSDLGKIMGESWSERPTALKSPMKSETVDKSKNRVANCSRCGIPLTPSKRIETSRTKNRKRAVVSWRDTPPLSLVQCFIVSRGCQLNEAAVARALARALGCPRAAEVSVRSVSALGLVAEQARPDADALILHLCSHDLVPSSFAIVLIEFRFGF